MEDTVVAAEASAPVVDRRLWVACGLISITAIGLAARWQPPAPAAAPPPSDIVAEHDGVTLAPLAPQWQFLKLATAAVTTARWTDPVTAHVTFDPRRTSKIGAPLAGHVTRIYVELGQRVRRGEPLFSVSSPDIAELRAAHDRAIVDLEAAQGTLARVKAIVATRALPAKEEVSAAQQERQAEVGLRLAEAKLAALRIQAERDDEFTVSAPRDGVLVEKNVFVDQQVTPDGSGSLLTLTDPASAWIVADVFETDAADIRVGSAAEVTTAAAPDRKLVGRVEMVPSAGDSARHTMPVRVALANGDGLLRFNSPATVRFEAAGRASSLEVPATALASDGSHEYVYVEDRAGHFTRREVAAGASRDGRVVILRGLAAGETVVAEGTILLDNQLALSE